ncbi:MAG: hypothetical protein A3D64_00675 [Candidatus Wildermuthbacteria bacterium RIFCSPHIGHO2_02_FULL_49_9]|uniref:Uncharacterized protein n=2 Tax=Candidatus Wildermuthiibacteriota TaxID=1817923 RepID=A0A1G2QW72_9BACT|nr:MAG: hypothetical protein A2672_01480 [Candidatus Wildermuthbacteria bacterium RIFCSPHIGHO2_01_FULL_49_22b]OHA70096.1 MAG: hypothetical protein A3D64_00675 [Candidatus Wildermuthbacteria bacterium RIFCSPHIGHO2_02_FULL_49_9]
MATVAEIQELYDQGKIPEAMAAVRGEVCKKRQSDNPEIPELCAIRAWCHYRRREWDNVRKWLGKAGNTLWAERLRAYMASYVDKDDEVLARIAQELGDDVSVQNALVIRARDPDSEVVILNELEGILARFGNQTEVDVANLFHNAARLLLVKGSTKEHWWTALGMMEDALVRYGSKSHWHHRAAAWYWESHIFERLRDKENALRAVSKSLFLWDRALELDPGNQGFRTNQQNALKRQAELVNR